MDLLDRSWIKVIEDVDQPFPFMEEGALEAKF